MKRFESSKDQISIESFGGTGGLITGSCHRVTISKDFAILIDSGMYQGKFEERSERGERRNLTPMKNIAAGVTDVLETHIHIDHIGRLPKIYKDGFTPTILATEVTTSFMEAVLLNSAEIQEEKNSQEKLYDKWDVDKTLRHIKTVKPFRKIDIGRKNSHLTAEFLPNGHVMGSSSIIVREHSKNTTILFTGDMGKANQSLCGGYKDFINDYPNDQIDILMTESTNFDKKPVNFEEKKKKFLESIQNTWENGGNPVLPTLSFHRTPELMKLINNCQKNGELPSDLKMIIDAPYAMELLEITKRIGSKYLSKGYGDNPNFYKTDEESISRFDLKNLTIIGSHKESVYTDKEMAEYKGKAIIIASGGMGGFGRSENYLHGDFAKNPKNTILFNCFQVPGAEGSELTKNEETITRYKKTGARISKLEGFTSHISGPEETFDFLERFNFKRLKKIIITHGKDSSRIAMAEEFKKRGYDAEIILSQIRQIIPC